MSFHNVAFCGSSSAVRGVKINTQRITHFVFLSTCFFLAINDPAASLNVSGASADFYAATAGRGSLARQIAFALIGLYGILGWQKLSASRLRIRGFGGVLTLVLLTWALISISWSTAPGASAARLVGLLALTLAAAKVRLSVNPEQVVVWVVSTTLCFLAVGVLSEVVLGTFHPWTAGYRFFGTLSPNEEGVNCSIAALGALWLGTRGNGRVVWKVLFVVAIVFDVLTKSRTALAATVVSLLIAAIVSRKDWRMGCLLTSLGATVLFVGITLQASRAVLIADSLAMGRDQSASDESSLTGRVPLWAELMESAREHPIAGVGFGGFWTPPKIYAISEDQGWGISGSHSSYMEMLLSLGGVGLFLYSLVVVCGAVSAFKDYHIHGGVDSGFFGTLLVFILVNGLADAESVNVSAFLCFCLVLASVHVLFRREFPALTRPAVDSPGT